MRVATHIPLYHTYVLFFLIRFFYYLNHLNITHTYSLHLMKSVAVYPVAVYPVAVYPVAVYPVVDVVVQDSFLNLFYFFNFYKSISIFNFKK